MSSLAPAAQQHHPPPPVLVRVGITSLSGSTSLPAHVTPTSKCYINCMHWRPQDRPLGTSTGILGDLVHRFLVSRASEGDKAAPWEFQASDGAGRGQPERLGPADWYVLVRQKGLGSLHPAPHTAQPQTAQAAGSAGSLPSTFSLPGASLPGSTPPFGKDLPRTHVCELGLSVSNLCQSPSRERRGC